MKEKKILAIETSGELCSTSLSFSIDKYDERNILMKHIHSEKLIPMISELLVSNSIDTNELDCIAVSIGPGSFTGLRIGMTAAKGIAFASNTPIVPVPSFGALSLEISEYIPIEKSFCIINNASIDECYFGKYQKVTDSVITIIEPKLYLKDELNRIITDSELVFGNIKVLHGINSISSPKASTIAKWTYLFGEDLLTFDYEYLEPNYLKKFKVKHK